MHPTGFTRMFKYTIRFRCKSKRFYILFMSLYQYFLALAFIYYSFIEINPLRKS